MMIGTQRLLKTKIKGFMKELEKAIELMKPTIEQYSEKNNRIIKLEMVLEQIRVECVLKKLYKMAEIIDEVV